MGLIKNHHLFLFYNPEVLDLFSPISPPISLCLPRFSPLILNPPTCGCGNLSLDTKYNILHTTSCGMEESLLQRHKNLNRIFPEAIGSVLNKPCTSRTRRSTLGVFRNCHGGCLIKGKSTATISVSCISAGQNLGPLGISK